MIGRSKTGGVGRARGKGWLLVAALALGACAADVGVQTELDGEDPVAASEQAILGGTTTTRRGVVDLILPAGNCSGVLLNRSAILTSAHCFPSIPGGQTQRLRASAMYKLANGTVTCLTREGVKTAEGSTRKICSQQTQLSDYDVSVFPGHIQRTDGTTDAATDLAIMKSRYVFADVSPIDYAPGRPLLYGTTPFFLEFFGYGHNSNNRTGGGTLRSGWGSIDAVHSTHINIEETQTRACKGDSGGPLAQWWKPELLVLGLISHGESDTAAEICTSDGSVTRSTYLAAKMGFITSKLGIDCPAFVHPGTQRWVRRCFNYPVAFRSRANWRYVHVGNGGSNPLIAAGDWIGPWERFEPISNPDFTTSFVSLQNHKLVTAENAGSASLIARATEIGLWEKFSPNTLTLNGLVGTAILAHANGKWVAAENAGSQPLIARTTGTLGPWEQFFFETVP